MSKLKNHRKEYIAALVAILNSNDPHKIYVAQKLRLEVNNCFKNDLRMDGNQFGYLIRYLRYRYFIFKDVTQRYVMFIPMRKR